MTRRADDPKRIVRDMVNDYKTTFEDALVSLIIYGSAASGDYVPGSSDINLMVVLSEAGIEDFDRAMKIVSRWRKRRVATPLLVTETYVKTSVDVFPLEYLNFRNSYEVIYGKDILADLTLDGQMLRLQCEREIRGKLLLLREGYLETDGADRHIRALLADSFHAVMAIFRGILYLRKHYREDGAGPNSGAAHVPDKKQEVIRQLCEMAGLEAEAFETVLDIKQKRSKPGGEALQKAFKYYLKEIGKLVRFVDDLKR